MLRIHKDGAEEPFGFLQGKIHLIELGTEIIRVHLTTPPARYFRAITHLAHVQTAHTAQCIPSDRAEGWIESRAVLCVEARSEGRGEAGLAEG